MDELANEDGRRQRANGRVDRKERYSPAAYMSCMHNQWLPYLDASELEVSVDGLRVKYPKAEEELIHVELSIFFSL